MNQGAAVKPRLATTTNAWHVIRWVIVGVVGLAVIAYFGIGMVAAMQLSQPKRNFDPAKNPGVFNLKYEEVHYPARTDQTSIAAWYIPSEANTRAIILVHGRDDSRTYAFKGHFVEFANTLHQAGFSVLMVDLRGHGQSGDGRFTFGIKERRDVLGGLDWLLARGYQPGQVAVLGYSLGAASVIGAAADEKAIGAVVTEAAYADIAPVINKLWVSQSGLPQLFLQPTVWMIQLLYGYDITASRPVDEIAKIAPRPMLMIHCTTDEWIDYTNLGKLHAQLPGAQTWTIEGCEHGFAYNFNPADYSRHVVQFLDSSLVQ